jgi:hypothetical protein
LHPLNRKAIRFNTLAAFAIEANLRTLTFQRPCYVFDEIAGEWLNRVADPYDLERRSILR